MATKKMQQKIHRVYSPEIIRTSSPGRLQKRSLEHNDCLLVCSVRIATDSQDSPNGQYLQFPKLVSNKLSKSYSNAFKKHQNDTGTICLNINWDMFLPNGLAELHMFFMTRSTTFFSSTIFVISRLLFFLIRRQSSEGVL